MSTAVMLLKLLISRGTLTVDMPAALCQLTRLTRLELHSVMDPPQPAGDIIAPIFLDLPVLELLAIVGFGPIEVRLNCPKLQGLILRNIGLKSFCGMPCSIHGVDLSLLPGSVPLNAIFSAHSAKLLAYLSIVQDPEEVTDPETVNRLCTNGSLKRLSIKSEETSSECDGAAAGAFALHAPWQLVPQTLQDVCLDLPLDKGIPRVLEQLLSLEKLSLRHSKRTCMHLDRPLDPFLAMPRLEQLKLELRWQNADVHGGGTLLNWSPAALRFLGLAEKRIKGMQMTAPKRSITLIY